MHIFAYKLCNNFVAATSEIPSRQKVTGTHPNTAKTCIIDFAPKLPVK